MSGELTLREVPQAPEMVAAVGRLQPSGVWRRFTNQTNCGKDIDQELREFDRSGPGFLGFYLDLMSDIPAMCPLTIEELNPDGEWVPTASSSLREELQMLRGPGRETQQEMVARMLRLLEFPGELTFTPIDPEDGSQDFDRRFWVLSPECVSEKGGARNRRAVLKMTPEASKKDGPDFYREVPFDQPHRVWRPDPTWPGQRWTTITRSRSELRSFRSAQRVIQRTLGSQIAQSKGLWFKGDGRELAIYANDQQADAGRAPSPLVASIKAMNKRGADNLNDAHDENVAGALPFSFVLEEKPEIFDLAREIDGNLLAAKRDALEDFARAQNIPMSVLVEGQGAAARMLNQVKQDEALKRTAIFPRIDRVANALTACWLEPLLRAANQTTAIGRVRVWSNKSALDADPDIARVESAVKCGGLHPDAMAHVLNMPQYALDWPDDMSGPEYLQMRARSETVRSDDERAVMIAESAERTAAAGGAGPWWMG